MAAEPRRGKGLPKNNPPKPPKPPLTIKIDLKRIKEQSEATDSQESISNSDEDLSVGEEEENLKIDWEEDENSVDIPEDATVEEEEEEEGEGEDEDDVVLEEMVETQEEEGGSEIEIEKKASDVDDEEEWLKALEMGEVDERGYLPDKGNRKLTARQRALADGGDSILMELPLQSKKKAETEEMLLKKSERNRKRKQRAAQRREEVKAETIQRLLQKQPTKKKEDGNGGHKRARVEGPAFSYRDSIVNGITISFPKEVESPFVAQKITKSEVPKVQKVQICCIKGCKNARKYADVTSKLPLCSLSCYRKLKDQNAQTPRL